MGLRKNNALKFLEDKTSDYAERVALGMKTSLGWNEFTYSGLGMLSRKLGHYLINGLELQKGEKLAILSESMPEYGACVFGSVLAGLTIVPLDVKLTIHEYNHILSDCLPRVICGQRLGSGWYDPGAESPSRKQNKKKGIPPAKNNSPAGCCPTPADGKRHVP